MIIDHIGIVVRSLERAIQRWIELFGYSVSSPPVVNTRQKVRVVFLSKHGSPRVKLLEPTGTDSPVSEFARKGGGLHHLCFRCDDMNAEIDRLSSKGARLIVAPEPGEAFNNNNIAFLWVETNLNVELIDTTEKAGWQTQSDPVSVPPFDGDTTSS